jgi:enediyne biosynthesis protein E4
VASRNGEPALAFHNQGRVGVHSFRVVLKGPSGNPNAIGARLTLTLADGSTQSAAVAAGSGYLSQSSPACFFTYPTASPPRTLAVTWPDGVILQHRFTAPPPLTLSLSAM